MQTQDEIKREVEFLKFKKDMSNLAQMIFSKILKNSRFSNPSIAELQLMKEYTENLLAYLEDSLETFPERNLQDQTSPEFVEFMNETSKEGLVDLYELRREFVAKYPIYDNFLSHSKFVRWVNLFTKQLK